MNDDFSDMLKIMHNPKRDALIVATITDSDFMPKAGDYFRVRFAALANRSYMGDIWQCIHAQDHCVFSTWRHNWVRHR